MGILDLFFPKYCVNCKKAGSYICSDCFPYISFDAPQICLVCSRPSVDGLTHPFCRSRHAIDGAFAALVYKGIVKKLIYSFKYKPFLTDLKNILIDLFYESLIQDESFSSVYQHDKEKEIILVPIPLFKSKLKSRGYNQAEILAQGLSKKFELKVFNMLERVRDTKTQVGLKKEERKENIEGAFNISNKYQFQISNFKSKTYFLVDDVLTTGSTFSEAAKVLKSSGAGKVYGLALAKD